ncbi:hypothetical protein C7K25_10890 [Gulosibacter molinativorax]|uniref:Uncharacterized protein n=2 Tax=Gulosibacter molinativorax TaxID=256821 RepID=A0ABT7CB47_9MICO|nr:hypothetical protein [Gulosibacter molinativorax]
MRALARAGTALALAVLASALVWLVWPETGPYVQFPLPLQQLFGDGAAAAQVVALVQALIGAAAASAGFGILTGRPAAAQPLAIVSLVCGALLAIGFVGFSGIAVAGYLMAAALPILALVVGLMVAKRPQTRVLVVVAFAALIVIALLSPIPFAEFYERLGANFATDHFRTSATVLFIGAAGVWLLSGMGVVAREPGRLGAFALRRRRALTIAAAACALPYVIARATWLTPWPLFGGDQIEKVGPEVLATGLLLGGAMLVGAVLTLGLIMTWGSRFPKWVPRIGSKPVPVALAVVPASIVAALFTAGGIETLITLFAGIGVAPVSQWILVIALPFWLWGPLLGLATWGYAQARALEPDAPVNSRGGVVAAA